MDIITGRVGCGKTVELIKRASKDNLIIVVKNHFEIESYIEMSSRLKLSILKPISYDDYYIMNNNVRCLRMDLSSKYIIADVASFLEKISDHQIKGFSCDAEDVTLLVHNDLGFFKKDLMS